MAHIKFGTFCSVRLNLQLTSELKEGLHSKLADPPHVLGGKRMAQANRMDGVKLIFEDRS